MKTAKNIHKDMFSYRLFICCTLCTFAVSLLLHVMFYATLGTLWLNCCPISQRCRTDSLHPGYTKPSLELYATWLKYTYLISTCCPTEGSKRSTARLWFYMICINTETYGRACVRRAQHYLFVLLKG